MFIQILQIMPISRSQLRKAVEQNLLRTVDAYGPQREMVRVGWRAGRRYGERGWEACMALRASHTLAVANFCCA